MSTERNTLALRENFITCPRRERMILKVSRISLSLLAVVFLAGACSKFQADKDPTPVPGAPVPHPTIVFMSDFGVANDAVAICKAVILGIVPDAHIMDITHQVTPYSIEEGARFLQGVTPYYPAGTVFLVVVDPGVGTSRKAIVVKSKKGQYFVLPDNGLITPVIDRDGLESAREITNTDWMIQSPISSTFHGRDIFSLVTLPYVKTFMEVPVGEPLLYVDSRGRVGIAINQGNYSKQFGVTPPAPVFIARKGIPLKTK